MAKLKAVIKTSRKDEPLDKRLPLKIRVTNGGVAGYIDTSWYACKNDFDEAGNLKDRAFRNMVEDEVEKYEKLIREWFGVMCDFGGTVIVANLGKRIEEEKKKDEKINVLDEFEVRIKEFEGAGKDGPASNYKVSRNHLINFLKKEKEDRGEGVKDEENVFLDVNNVTFNFLRRFEGYLMDEARKKGFMGKRCLSLTMSNLRAIFNRLIEKYNDEDKRVVRITHYPFKKYKIVPPVSTKDRSITVRDVRELFEIEVVNSRDILAQDMFMLIICLAGINTVDLYKMKKENYKRGVLSYNRSKTEEKRRDSAFTSFHVTPEGKKLIAKYLDDESSDYLFNFHKRYCNFKEFGRGVNKGLKHISGYFDLPYMTTYSARYTFARVANKKAGVSSDVIAICLNHAAELELTEIYTGRDYTKIDKTIRQVLDILFPKKKETKKISKIKESVFA